MALGFKWGNFLTAARKLFWWYKWWNFFLEYFEHFEGVLIVYAAFISLPECIKLKEFLKVQKDKILLLTSKHPGTSAISTNRLSISPRNLCYKAQTKNCVKIGSWHVMFLPISNRRTSYPLLRQTSQKQLSASVDALHFMKIPLLLVT